MKKDVWVLVLPDNERFLKEIPGFIPVEKYSAFAWKNEYGMLEIAKARIRFQRYLETVKFEKPEESKKESLELSNVESVKENKCSKCEDFADGICITHDCKTYHFCKTCSCIIQSFPDDSKILDVFLQPSKSWPSVTKSIFEAKKKRALGISAWK